jgi:hypothetical protein
LTTVEERGSPHSPLPYPLSLPALHEKEDNDLVELQNSTKI